MNFRSAQESKPRMMPRVKFFAGLLFVALIAGGLYFKWDPLVSEIDQALHGPYSVEERVSEYGEVVKSRLKSDFDQAGVAYPPDKITLVVLKEEKQVELYAEDAEGDEPKFIRTYPILAASGVLGPKLREGDWQVPEGVYGVESLNPNSHYHLALHVDYPNAFDREEARIDGRSQLGGDIMIHGSNVSIGCVAIGNSPAEDIFVLAAKVGVNKIRLLFCPFDFRLKETSLSSSNVPKWEPELYSNLAIELKKLPLPPPSAQAAP